MKVRNTEFLSKTDYMAGLRDSGRIELLLQETDLSDPSAVASLYRELKNQPFYFETEVGKDFMKDLQLRTRPSQRGIGTGIRRRGYRSTKEEEARISAYEETRTDRFSDSIRIIGNDPEEDKRWQEALAQLEKDEKKKKNRAKKKTSKNLTKKAKEPKEKKAKFRSPKEQKRTLLMLTGILATLVLAFCFTDEASYRIKSYASERKMSDLQKSVFVPMELDKDKPVMERIAMASDAVVSDGFIKEANETGLSIEDTKLSSEEKSEVILPEYETLYQKNASMIGWIRIPDTKINYPVMQTKDDMEYYLRRDFDGEEDVNGLPFLDARCDIELPTTNFLVYGHNMKNGSMFAGLSKYRDEDFFKDHATIYFDTIYERGEYEIIAVFQSRVAYVDEIAFRYYNFIQAETKEEFDTFLSAVKKLRYYDTGKEAEFGDQLLTLSTCDREITDGRLVVLARKVSKSIDTDEQGEN